MATLTFALTCILAACGGGGPGTTGATPPGVGLHGPTPSPKPAYCSAYTPLAAGVPLNITDDAGLRAALIVYVTNGVSFMDKQGAFTSAAPVPYAAACFSTTTNSGFSQKPLYIPANTGGGRIYLAYATPVPNHPEMIPNPLAGSNVSGPNVGYAAATFPWDKLEYGTTAGATIDTTQVDALGLPIELSVTGSPLPSADSIGRAPEALPSPCATGGPAIVGVTACNYAKIFTQMEQIAPYDRLVVTKTFNGKLIDMQIVAPKDAVSFTSFPWNLFAETPNLPAPVPAICPAAPVNGYLSCVLNAYNTGGTQRLFTSNVPGVVSPSGDNYCAKSDGTANFLFTDVGPAVSCAGATPNPAVSPNPFVMPANEFTYGVAPTADNPANACVQDILFSLPWGNANVGGGHVFATADAFALWKAVTADLNRGTMLSTSQTHPVGISSPTMSLFFQDGMYSEYAYVIHTYFNNNLAYALAYDDLGNFESGLTWNTGDPINVRINAVPAAAKAIPSAAPVPTPVPSPCGTLRPNVGTF